jgi:hypothetical protein
VVRRVHAGICWLTSKDCVGARRRAHLCWCSKTSSSLDVVPGESIFDPIPLYLLIFSFKIWYNDFFIIFRFFQCFSVHLFYDLDFFFFLISYLLLCSSFGHVGAPGACVLGDCDPELLASNDLCCA